jgi:hypothetical protein
MEGCMKIKSAIPVMTYYVEVEDGEYGDVTEYRSVYRDEELRTEFLRVMREKG